MKIMTTISSTENRQVATANIVTWISQINNTQEDNYHVEFTTSINIQLNDGVFLHLNFISLNSAVVCLFVCKHFSVDQNGAQQPQQQQQHQQRLPRHLQQHL